MSTGADELVQFRTTFQQIWEVCTHMPREIRKLTLLPSQLADKFDKQGIPLKDYLKFAEELERHLQAHHGIEGARGCFIACLRIGLTREDFAERYIFPILATRMPEFQEEHPEEHEKIHEGPSCSLLASQTALMPFPQA